MQRRNTKKGLQALYTTIQATNMKEQVQRVENTEGNLKKKYMKGSNKQDKNIKIPKTI